MAHFWQNIPNPPVIILSISSGKIRIVKETKTFEKTLPPSSLDFSWSVVKEEKTPPKIPIIQEKKRKNRN